MPTTRVSFLEKIYCAIEVPDVFRERAWYGLRMLLLPFRVEPVLVDKVDLDGVSIYYGRDTSDLADITFAIQIDRATLQFFEENKPHPQNRRFVRIADQRVPVLFEASGSLTFDPVAATFFFLSSWQEIKTRQRDEHGRFPFEASIQHGLKTVTQPSVEWYRHVVAEALRKRGATLQKKEWADSRWMFCATHDIDYDKKWRPGIYKRELLDRVILNREKESIAQRILRASTCLRSIARTDDPFRSSMIRIREEILNVGGRATYFFKSAGRGLRDVPYDLHEGFMFEQIMALNRSGFEIGLHPSYHSYLSQERIECEKEILATVSGRTPLVHRAHYLRFDHPRSAHILRSCGFNLDSSLGFANQCGFRNATCLPFPLFDAASNTELALWEMPLVVMESALFNRQNLTQIEAERETNLLMQTCSRFGGLFVGLWHNTLWDERDYPGWGAHFMSAIAESQRLGGRIDTLSRALESWK